MRNRFWAVLATKQASSMDARRHVVQQDFEIYHPMYRSRPDRGVRQVLPLFPYYLLVRIDLRKNWKSLSSTRGVRQIMMNGITPSPVPDEDVRRFRDLENELGYFEHPDTEAPRFHANEPVVGTTGLFAGCSGIYQGLVGNSHERVRVLFRILGVPKVLEVKAFDLASAAC
jgi:transcription antitermination factor NusG